MEQQDEWGPWVEHDGSGCPCRGKYVNLIQVSGKVSEAIAAQGWGPDDENWNGWTYHDAEDHPDNVISYRIRKPRGMVILEALLQDLPQTVTEDSPA